MRVRFPIAWAFGIIMLLVGFVYKVAVQPQFLSSPVTTGDLFFFVGGLLFAFSMENTEKK